MSLSDRILKLGADLMYPHELSSYIILKRENFTDIQNNDLTTGYDYNFTRHFRSLVCLLIFLPVIFQVLMTLASTKYKTHLKLRDLRHLHSPKSADNIHSMKPFQFAK